MFKLNKIVLLMMIMLLSVITSFPPIVEAALQPVASYQGRDFRNPVVQSPTSDSELREEGRIFFAQLIESVDWLPIEINVPDALGAMFYGFESMYGFFFGGGGSSSEIDSSVPAGVIVEPDVVILKKLGKKLKETLYQEIKLD